MGAPRPMQKHFPIAKKLSMCGLLGILKNNEHGKLINNKPLIKNSLEPVNVHEAYEFGQQMFSKLAVAILQQAGTTSHLKTIFCNVATNVAFISCCGIFFVHERTSKQQTFEDLTFIVCGQIINLHVVFE